MIPLLARDLRLALRSGGGFGLGLAFFAIVVILVPFAVGPDPARLAGIAPGVPWLAALLAALLTLDRVFQLDWEDGTLEALATSDLPLEGVVLAKAAAHWATGGLPLALVALPLAASLALPGQGAWPLVASLLVGTPALSLIGAFAAALTVGVKRSGLLLSLLALPLYIPTLILGAEVARRGAEGLAWGQPMALLAGLSLGCLAALPFAAAAGLRTSLRTA